MPTVSLTYAELAFLVNFIPPLARFPHPAWAEDSSILPHGEREAGGPLMRLKLIAWRQGAQCSRTVAFDVEFTPGELWLLDSYLWLWNDDHASARTGPAADNTLAPRLCEKVWNAMLPVHAALLPDSLQGKWAKSVKVAPGELERQREMLRQIDKGLGEGAGK